MRAIEGFQPLVVLGFVDMGRCTCCTIVSPLFFLFWFLFRFDCQFLGNIFGVWFENPGRSR